MLSDSASVEFMLREFHTSFGLVVNDKPIDFSLENDSDANTTLGELRTKLMVEEFEEMMEAHEGEDLPAFAKEVCDMVYVAVGTLVSYGVSFDKCFAEVHRSNMSKLGEDGHAIYNAYGKVIKGPFYSPANLRRIIYGSTSEVE
jgi:phosphoribosyl-ATP pyrophosphohydrolase